MRSLVILTALALVAAGCSKKTDEPAPAASASSTPASAGSIAAKNAAAGEAASEEDFEDEAETAITEENFDTELSKMEKEIP